MIEDKVDKLLSLKDSDVKPEKLRNKKSRSVFVCILIVSLLLITTMLTPGLFNEKSGFDILQSFFESNGEDDVSVGDEGNESAAYHYWYAPEHSMGISSMKTVNWSYFKQLFLSHTDWMLEYKRYNYSSWTDGSDYLTIERTWNDTEFWKFNLILDVPVDIYSARFTFDIDLPCLQYVERSGYEVWINYTANATETYSCMFNWSDIAGIPNLVITKGIQDGMYWFRFRRDNIPAGVYSFDPTFGQTGEIEDTNIGGMTIGSFGDPPSSGTVDNITAWIQRNNVNLNVTFALYEYIDYSSDYAGTLIATTETKNYYALSETEDWNVFNFSDPKPSVVTSTNYYIIGTFEGESDWCRFGYASSGGADDRDIRESGHGGTFEDPWEGESTGTVNWSAYCSYTEGVANNAPTITGEIPANQSTGISLIPQLNVTVDDADDDWLNVTWSSNSSNDWVWFAKNSSIDGATLPLSIVQTNSNFTGYSTTYWWSVNVSDSTTWTNVTYSFTTTAANNAPTQSGESPTNSSTGIGLTPQLYVVCTDADAGDTMNATWRSNSSGDWVDFATNSSISTGTNITQDNSNLSAYSTTYYWSVNLTDGTDWSNETYHFTTVAPWSNTAPTLTNEIPANQSTDIQRYPQLNITVTDADGNNSEVYWYTNATEDDSWYLLQTNSSVLNETISLMNFTNASALSTRYWWRVSANDSIDNTTEIYYFTIEAEAVLTLTNEYPTNGSNIFSVQPTLYFTLASPVGGMSYSLYIGNTNITTDYLLDSDSGLDNGTFHYVNFYNASTTGTTYWWRVHYNDSSGHVNDTFSFQPVLSGGGGMGGVGGAAIAMGVAGGVLGGLVGAMLFMRRRKRER